MVLTLIVEQIICMVRGIGLFLANNVFESVFSSGKKTFKQLEMLVCLFCSVRLKWIKISFSWRSGLDIQFYKIRI